MTLTLSRFTIFLGLSAAVAVAALSSAFDPFGRADEDVENFLAQAETLAEDDLHARDGIALGMEAVHAAVEGGLQYLALPRDDGTLDSAASNARARNMAQARREAEMVLEVEQPAEVARRAHDILGFVAMEDERWEQAHHHLTVAQSLSFTNTSLTPYRTLWRARAAYETGRWVEARDAAIEVSETMPRDIGFHEARFLAERARLHLPDEAAEALRALDGLLERYTEYPYQDRLTIEMATAEEGLGDVQAATRRLDALLWDRPQSPHADRARQALVRLRAHGGTPRNRTLTERLERGRSIRLRRHWDVAEQALRSTLDDASESSTEFQNRVRFQLALNAYDSARFEDAIAWMDEIDEHGRTGISSWDRAIWRARPLSRIGLEEDAYDVMLAYYEGRGRHDHRFLGEFTYDLGMFERAVEHYDHVWSSSDWRGFDGAFLRYLAGDHEFASDAFERLAGRATGTYKCRYLYWAGRALAEQARFEEAFAAWEAAIAERPADYYALQAANRLLEYDHGVHEAVLVDTEEGDEAVEVMRVVPASNPGRIHWDGIDGQPSATLSALDDRDHFHEYREGADYEGGLERFVATYDELFPSAELALALYDVGAREDARRVFRDVAYEVRVLYGLFEEGRSVTTSRPIRLERELWAHEIDNRRREAGWWGLRESPLRYPVPAGGAELATFVERHGVVREERDAVLEATFSALEDVGDAFLVRNMAQRFLTYAAFPMEDPERRPSWLRAFPRAYGRLIQGHAERYDLNPYPLWGLMIVESDLNPDSISHADAYGLLQVIPKTGELVALREGEEDFGVHDLLEPAESIRYGTYYLNELLYKFDGQEMLAWVSYNAGPHQVARWLDWRGDVMDMDEFIETVPYDGARRYPQRVIQYLAVYRALYFGESQLYIGNELDTAYEDNIYF